MQRAGFCCLMHSLRWSRSTQSLPMLVASLLLPVAVLLHCSSSILGSPENRLTGQEAACTGYLAFGRITWLVASSPSAASEPAFGKSFSSRGAAAYGSSITIADASGCCNGISVFATPGGCCDGNTAVAESDSPVP
jgi:hypothetical protein